MTNKKTLYDYSDYKAYLKSRLGEKSSRRGLKSALAKAMRCQPTYISQILNGHAEMSPEQATILNHFFSHTKEESHFFLLLLSRDRAGNSELKKYYQEQINDALEKRLNLTKRLGVQNPLSEEQKNIFYSSWHYLAIQIALTVPDLQTKEALARHFQIPLKRVGEIIEYLQRIGLVKQVGTRYESTNVFLRIGNDSPHIIKHHSNWRLKVLESLDREGVTDLHYSAVVSLSQSDVLQIKNRILENIKEYLTTIKESKEEEVYSLCIDFFNLSSE